jgi:hypothetical protein
MAIEEVNPTNKLKEAREIWNANDEELVGLVEILQNAVSQPGVSDHDLLTNIRPADPTSTNTMRNKHVSNADLKSIVDHVPSASNPHGTTAAQTGAIPTTQKGAANGVAALDSNQKLLAENIPSGIGGGSSDHDALTNVRPVDPTSSDVARNKHVSNSDLKANVDHRNIVSGNPHGTTAAQVGALTQADGDARYPLQEDIAELLSQDEADQLYAPIDAVSGGDTPTTRTMHHQFGSTWFQVTAFDVVECLERLQIRLPVNTKRWRLKFRSIRSFSNVVATGVWTFQPVYFGKHALDANKAMTGNFTAAPVQVLPAFTTASDASEYVSGWIDNPAHQIQADEEHIISVGWTTPAGVTKWVSGDMAMVAAGAGNAVKASQQTVTGLTRNGVIGQFSIDYEVESDCLFGLVVGDSLSEGVGTMRGMSYAWPNLWAYRTRNLVTNMAGQDSKSSEFTNFTQYKWTKLAGINYDFAVVELGGNDLLQGIAVATIQTNIRTIVDYIRNTLGVKKIYYGSILPLNRTDAAETNRTTLNKWIKALPQNTDGLLEIDKILADRTNFYKYSNEYEADIAPDGLHPGTPGHNAISMQFNINQAERGETSPLPNPDVEITLATGNAAVGSMLPPGIRWNGSRIMQLILHTETIPLNQPLNIEIRNAAGVPFDSISIAAGSTFKNFVKNVDFTPARNSRIYFYATTVGTGTVASGVSLSLLDSRDEAIGAF